MEKEKPKVGDICLFWNDGMKIPYLNTLKSFSNYPDVGFSVYVSEDELISYLYGEQVSKTEFYNCEKFDGTLPDSFKHLIN